MTFSSLALFFIEDNASDIRSLDLRLDSKESCLSICTTATHQITQSKAYLFFYHSWSEVHWIFPLHHIGLIPLCLGRQMQLWTEGGTPLIAATCTDLCLQLFLKSLCTTASYFYSILSLLFKRNRVRGAAWPPRCRACHVLMRLILYFPQFSVWDMAVSNTSVISSRSAGILFWSHTYNLCIFFSIYNQKSLICYDGPQSVELKRMNQPIVPVSSL